jgi:hypothetical protein
MTRNEACIFFLGFLTGVLATIVFGYLALFYFFLK